MLKTFVDASIFVAVLGGKDDWLQQTERLDEVLQPISSPLAAWEAVVALNRSRKLPLEKAQQAVSRLLEVKEFKVVSLGDDELREAINAYGRYGKGRHPAHLNMGDCFAYACAKVNGARLLYKGDDFALTDLA